MLWVVAQVEVVSERVMPGGAGWAGAAGAGLLAGVLSWLMFIHLPSKDKQLKEFVTAKDENILRLTAEFREALHLVEIHCHEEIKMTREYAREQLLIVTERFKESLVETIASSCAGNSTNDGASIEQVAAVTVIAPLLRNRVVGS